MKKIVTMNSEKKFIPLSGTFIDAIACDIPSNNWTPDIWEREFARYNEIGIDEAYIIRVGWQDSSCYKSEVMKTTLYNDTDMVQLLLDLGAKYNVGIYLGMFDTCKFWLLNDWENEIAVNLDLIDELMARYGNHPAFKGWYMSHEGSMEHHQTRIWKPLCNKIRSFDRVRPIMVSPRYAGPKYDPRCVIPPDVHAKHFDYILNEMEGLINIYAPMDGHVHFNQLESYMSVTAELMQKYGVEYWTNLETFDRDMPWRFPPIEWAKFRHKLEVAQKYVSKVISFEVPHFMSPDSIYSSAGCLYNTYKNYLKKMQG